jgi:DNA-binding transcriptional ArsR family regulator
MGERVRTSEPRERSGERGAPASEQIGGSGGAKPAGLINERCDISHLNPERVGAARSALLPAEEAADLAETFKLLGDVTRVRILDALSRQELCVCDLAALVGLSESAVSHQLRLLRGMRIVRSRKSGRMVFYALDDQHIISLFQQASVHITEAGRSARARSATRR